MENVVEDKSFAFAVRIVKACNYLRRKTHDTVLTNQLLRAGTSIGANIAEAQQAHSYADFIAKMTISLKEASECAYWLSLMAASGFLTEVQADSLIRDCRELQRLLTAIVKTARNE